MARPSLRPWLIVLGGFYLAWLTLVVAGHGFASLLSHKGIAIAMGIGSYIAGATPMGGGSVGFPVLVLLFGEQAELGRDFSFAVQSVGMTSAGVYIIASRQPLEWPMLRWAMIGSALGTPLGIVFVAPLASALAIKLVFGVIWASFGVLHLHRIREFTRHEGLAPGAHRFDRSAGLVVGFGAGLVVASVTGVGIDMLLYVVLVLLCQADLKIAIPTSVLIMAFTSLVGVITKALWVGFAPGVYENWLAAAPVVALGAPLGAFIVARVGRAFTLYCVSVLCVAQFIWVLYSERASLGVSGAMAAALAVLLCNAVFHVLYSVGARLDRRGQRAPAALAGLERA